MARLLCSILFVEKKQSGHTLKVNNAEELWEEYGIGIEKDYYKEFHD